MGSEDVPAGSSCPRANELIRYESYGGPGRWFTRAPERFKATRKHYVVFQCGGLDI